MRTRFEAFFACFIPCTIVRGILAVFCRELRKIYERIFWNILSSKTHCLLAVCSLQLWGTSEICCSNRLSRNLRKDANISSFFRHYIQANNFLSQHVKLLYLSLEKASLFNQNLLSQRAPGNPRNESLFLMEMYTIIS